MADSSSFPWRERFAALIEVSDPPALGPDPRPGRLSIEKLDRLLSAAVAMDPPIGRNEQSLVRGLLLLWHDHLDEAHAVAQEMDSSEGSYLHGIMHRREPDYGNAKYWFRRAGNLPIFSALAARAASASPEIRETVAASGRWDPLAFVDACARANALGPGSELYQSVQAIQSAEFQLLLEHFLSD